MTADREREVADALHRQVDGVVLDAGRAFAEFPRHLARRRRRRRGATLAAAATIAAVAVISSSVTGERQAVDLPVDEPRLVVPIEPRGSDIIPLGAPPSRVSLRGSTLWAALSTGSLARVDTARGTASRIGSLPSTPFDVEPTDRWVWVSLPFDNQILALDPVDGHVVHTVTTASPGPRGLTLASGSLWCTAGTALLELDPRTGDQLRSVPLPAAGLPYDLVVGVGSVWVTDARTTVVTRYLLNDRRLEQIDVGGPSVGVALADGTVWVARKDAAHLVRLDARTGRVVSEPPLPSPALGLATIGAEVWAGVPDADQVMSFDVDTGEATRSWRVGDFPPIVTGDDQSIYVSSNHTNEIIRVPMAVNPAER